MLPIKAIQFCQNFVIRCVEAACLSVRGLTSVFFKTDPFGRCNKIKHGITLAEQIAQRRAWVLALVVDRYQHRSHLDMKYRFLFHKTLAAKLEESNPALYSS